MEIEPITSSVTSYLQRSVRLLGDLGVGRIPQDSTAADAGGRVLIHFSPSPYKIRRADSPAETTCVGYLLQSHGPARVVPENLEKSDTSLLLTWDFRAAHPSIAFSPKVVNFDQRMVACICTITIVCFQHPFACAVCGDGSFAKSDINCERSR